jgi:hypothetical protein
MPERIGRVERADIPLPTTDKAVSSSLREMVIFMY